MALTSASFGNDGSLTVASDDGIQIPAAAYVESTYPRAKGEKVLHRIDLPAGDLAHDPNFALTRYDWVFPVDTNTPGEPPGLCFVGVLQTKVLLGRPGELRLQIHREMVIELHNVTVSPERLGWSFVARSIVNRQPNSRIALIVDSEFSELSAINRREQPLLADYMLPDGVELLYASTDAGGGYLANDLLRACDHNAREVSKLQKDQNAPPLREARPRAPFSHVRVWERPVIPSANSSLQPLRPAPP